MVNHVEWNVFISLFLFFVLMIFIGLCYWWSFALREKPTINITPNYEKAQVGDMCVLKSVAITSPIPEDFTPRECDVGLECVFIQPTDTAGYCLKSLGSECNSLLECVKTALYCRGSCSTTPGNGLDKPCITDTDCATDFVCNSANVCKKTNTTVCSGNSECNSGYCSISNVCEPIQPIGGICTEDSGCTTGFCSNGYCQNTGVVTGSIGAFCNLNATLLPSCSSNTTCFADLGTNPSATTGVCYDSSTNGVCRVGSSCVPPLICVSGKCQYPSNPNSCSITGVCSSGNTCTNGLCVPQSNTVNLRRWSGNQWKTITSLNYTPVDLDIYSNGTNILYMVSKVGSGPFHVPSVSDAFVLYLETPSGITTMNCQLDYRFDTTSGFPAPPPGNPLETKCQIVSCRFVDPDKICIFMYLIQGPNLYYRFVVLDCPSGWINGVESNLIINTSTIQNSGYSLPTFPVFPSALSPINYIEVEPRDVNGIRFIYNYGTSNSLNTGIGLINTADIDAFNRMSSTIPVFGGGYPSTELSIFSAQHSFPYTLFKNSDNLSQSGNTIQVGANDNYGDNLSVIIINELTFFDTIATIPSGYNFLQTRIRYQPGSAGNQVLFAILMSSGGNVSLVTNSFFSYPGNLDGNVHVALSSYGDLAIVF
jgi:hypothetical protein